MAGDERGKEPSFKVQDRRRFSATGDAREEVSDERAEADAPPSEPRRTEPPRSEAPSIEIPGGDLHGADHTHEHAATDMDADGGAEITFASFVFSLSTQVLVHLGEVPDPIDGTAHVNLDAARQIIDILAILRDKTRGNLDAAESSLLESALYDLRMRYVDRARAR